MEEIYQELVLIRKELQAIRSSLEPKALTNLIATELVNGMKEAVISDSD